jgi:hypothetical protein
VNNRGRAPSKYVNKLAIGFYFFMPEVKQYGLLNSRIQIEQLRHDQVDGIFPVLKITLS